MGTRVGTQRVQREPGYVYYVGKDGYVWAAPRRGKGGAKKRVTTEQIKREPGYLYYVDSAGYVSRAPMKRRGAA